MDTQKLLLLEALRALTAPPGELRLYRRGKFPGLFATRTHANSACAEIALNDGLIEIARIETRGKSVVEWVRLTPRGMDYLLQHEAPVRVLEELRSALATTEQGIPAWVAELRKGIDGLQQRLDVEVDGVRRRLDELSRRALDAIERLEGTHGADSTATPWLRDVVTYVEQKQQAGLGESCPLAELFAVVRAKQVDVSLHDFHVGLRRLQDRGQIQLLATDAAGQVSAPEYALLDGPTVYHFVAAA